MHLESRKAQETRRYLLDFGFTPDVYANNLELLKIDVSQVDALIISHGHYDHVGGLLGFLEACRPRMRKELRLYTGGRTISVIAHRNADGSFTEFGAAWTDAGSTLWRAVVSRLHDLVKVSLPAATPPPARTAFHTWVEYASATGWLRRQRLLNHHFTAEELAGSLPQRG